MASKKCLICNTAFQGRRDARTCSDRCRKRLHLSRQAVIGEVSAIKRSTFDEIGKLGHELTHVIEQPSQGGYVDVPAFTPPAAGTTVMPGASSVSTPVIDTSPQADQSVVPVVEPLPVVAPSSPVTATTSQPQTELPAEPLPVENPQELAVASPEPTPFAAAVSLNDDAALASGSLEQPSSQVGTGATSVVVNQSAISSSAPTTEDILIGPKRDWMAMLSARQHPLVYGLASMILVMIIGLGVYSRFFQKTAIFTPLSSQTDQTLTADSVGKLNINRSTVITGGNNLLATGDSTFQNQKDSTTAFVVQNAANSNLLVVDTQNGRVGVGGAPTGLAAFQVAGAIAARDALTASGGSSSISDSGLVINGNTVCSAAGCKSASSTISAANLPSSVTLQGNTFNGSSELVQTTAAGALPALSGANLTNVDAATLNGQAGSYYTNASNISSGTLSNSRLSNSVTLQGNNFNGASQLVQLTGGGLLPVLNGSNLTNVDAISLNGQTASYYTNASNISSGTLADARLSANVTLQGNAFNGASQLVELTGGGLLPVLDGSNLTNVDAASLNGQVGSYYTDASNISSGTLADARLTANVTLQGNSFNGTSELVQTTAGGLLPVLDGSNLTNLNATNVSSGTLADARLSTNVTLQGNTFNGSSQLVQTTAGGALPVISGVNLTNLNASNLASGTVADVRLSGNVALLNGTGPQTFTGNNKFTGAVVQQNAVNSTSAFQIQNDLGTSNLFVADTTNNRIGIDLAGPAYQLDVAGDVNVTGAYRIGTLPICTAGGCTASAGSNDYIQNQSAVSQAGDFRITGTGQANTSILTASLDTPAAGALSIGSTNATSIGICNSSACDTLNIATNADADTITIGDPSDTFALNSTGLTVSSGGALSGISTIATSSTINSQSISSAANFTGTVTIQGPNSLTLGTTGSATGSINFQGATGASGTINLLGQANPNGTRVITLPDETGTVCTTGSICSGYQGAGSYANADLSNLASVAINTSLLAGADNTIDIGNSTTKSFRSGYFDTSVLSPSFDTQAAGALAIGNNNATSVGICNSASCDTVQIGTNADADTISIGDALDTFSLNSTGLTVSSAGALSGITTIGTSSTINSQTISSAANFTGTVTIQGSSALTLGATGTSTGQISFLGSTGASGTINLVGQANPTGTRTITLPNLSGTVCLDVGNCSAGAGDILQGGNTFGADITVGTNDNYGLNLETNNTTVASLSKTGQALFKNSADSTTAFQIQDHTGSSDLFIADTTSGRIGIGGAPSNGILDVTGDIFQNGYQVCDTSGGCAGTGGIGNVLQDGNTFGTALTLGTNDNYGFNLETNNTTVASLSNTGQALFKNASDSATAFRVQDASSNNFLLADTSGGALSLCNSTNCDTVTIGTNADADTIQIGDGLDTLTLTGNSSSTIVLNGSTISAAELNLLDGHDVALVDTNDAVATAITGTGALDSGSITANFGSINTGADNITTTGTVQGSTSVTTANLDAAASGALGIGNLGTATSVGICNSANCDTVSIGTNADADTINIGDALDTFSLNSTGLTVSSAGALSGITTIGTSSTINSQTISSAANFTGTVVIQGSSALTLGTTGSATGSIAFKGATGASGTINLIGQTNPTGAQNITLPNETGTVCTTGSVCSGYAPASGGSYANQALSNLSAVAVNTSLLAGSDNAYDIGDNSTKSFRTGYFDTSVLTPTLDTQSAGTLGVGDSGNATGVSICNSAACDTIQLGTNADADTIQIGDASDTLTLTGNSSSTIVLNGSTISAAELNLLDGHDVALVDTNDAVSTAIIGTGALNGGSITSGFGAIDTGADNISTTGTVKGGTSVTTADVDAAASGALGIGNLGTATSVGICNSANCDTISIGTNADADAINVGDALDTVTIKGSSASTFVINGATVDATEFNRLDGKDAALVDTNDAVATAITGTGALDAGSITSGFGSIDVGADNISTTGTVKGTTSVTTANLDAAASGALGVGNLGTATSVSICNSANCDTLQLATNADADTIQIGDSTDTVTITGGASSTFVINGATVDATEFDRLDGKDAALVDTNDAVATAITGTGALNAGSITSGFGAIDTGADNITTTGTISAGRYAATGSAPGISAATGGSSGTTCGTSPPADSISGTDSAGQFTVTAGTGTPGTCQVTITFASTYGADPKAIVLSPASSKSSANLYYVSATSGTGSTFTINLQKAAGTGDVFTEYYWVIK